MKNFDYSKSNFTVGRLEINLLMKSYNYVSLTF